MIALHILYPDISATQIMAELAREAQARRRFYPRQVENLRMTQAEADHQLAMVDAWREDLQRMGSTPPMPDPQPKHGFTWNARRQALAREIDLRARVYPRHVAEGKLTAADATHRQHCLMALAATYDDGFDWFGSRVEFFQRQLALTGRADDARRHLVARRFLEDAGADLPATEQTEFALA